MSNFNEIVEVRDQNKIKNEYLSTEIEDVKLNLLDFRIIFIKCLNIGRCLRS